MKRKNKDFQRRIQNPLEHYDEAFLRKQLTGQGRRVVNVVDRVLNTTLVLIIAKKLPRRQDSLYSEEATENYKVTDLLSVDFLKQT